jgi:hypothetical protein
MIIELDRTGEPGCFRTLLDRVANPDRVRSILVLACDDNGFTAEQVDGALGEIANNRKEYLEFYNKTAVVGVIQN